MAVVRSAWMAVVLAGTLVGCSPLRWHRGTASATAASRPAIDYPIAATTPPEAAPALCIPGPAPETGSAASAQASVSKSEAIATLQTPSGVDTATTLPALTPSEPAAAENPLLALHRRAAHKWSQIDTYACRIRRREAIGGQPRPEEVIAAKFRKEPFSAYFQWLGPEAKGREVVYVQGGHGNLIHTLTAPGDIFLVAGGTRFKIAPDSMLVKNKSRYPITDAGVGALIDRFGHLVQALERGEPRTGSAKYLGQLKRKEYEHKVEAVLQSIAPGAERLLPGGGQRLWCFDPEHALPVLIVTHDEMSREVEYYCHDRFEFSGRFTDDDFNPDKLWAKAPSRAAGDE